MAEQEIIDLTKKLLDSIVRKDFKEYEEVCEWFGIDAMLRTHENF